jgi:hypothetical protein
MALCTSSILQGVFNVPPSLLKSVLDYSSLFIAFSFAGEGFILLRGCAGLFSQGGKTMQASWSQLSGEMVLFSQLREAFHEVGVQDVTGIDSH